MDWFPIPPEKFAHRQGLKPESSIKVQYVTQRLPFPNLIILQLLMFHVAGIQHAPAVGRSIMEMILDGGFETIDLKRMSFDRLITDTPLMEQNIF
jgi:hypothetical protein